MSIVDDLCAHLKVLQEIVVRAGLTNEKELQTGFFRVQVQLDQEVARLKEEYSKRLEAIYTKLAAEDSDRGRAFNSYVTIFSDKKLALQMVEVIYGPV